MFLFFAMTTHSEAFPKNFFLKWSPYVSKGISKINAGNYCGKQTGQLHGAGQNNAAYLASGLMTIQVTILPVDYHNLVFTVICGLLISVSKFVNLLETFKLLVSLLQSKSV